MIKIGVSTLLFFKIPLSEGIIVLLENGIRNIELFCDEPFANPLRISKKEIQKIQKIKEKNNIKFSIHAPCFDLNTASINPRIREEVFKNYIGSLKLAKKVGANAVVVHLGNRSDMKVEQENSLNWSIDIIKRVLRTAEEYKICLLLENTDYGNLSIINNIEQLKKIIQGFNSPFLKAVLDTGHANLKGIEMPQLIKILGKRLGSLHISDNKGDKDSHLPPGKGVINFKSIFDALENIKFNGTAILEIYDENYPLKALEWSISYIESISPYCQI